MPATKLMMVYIHAQPIFLPLSQHVLVHGIPVNDCSSLYKTPMVVNEVFSGAHVIQDKGKEREDPVTIHIMEL